MKLLLLNILLKAGIRIIQFLHEPSQQQTQEILAITHNTQFIIAEAKNLITKIESLKK